MKKFLLLTALALSGVLVLSQGKISVFRFENIDKEFTICAIIVKE